MELGNVKDVKAEIRRFRLMQVILRKRSDNWSIVKLICAISALYFGYPYLAVVVMGLTLYDRLTTSKSMRAIDTQIEGLKAIADSIKILDDLSPYDHYRPKW